MLLLLLGCIPSSSVLTPGSVPDAPGQGAAAYCEETGRAAVADPTAPADGLAFSAADVLGAFAIPWTGTWSPYAGPGGTADVSLLWSDGAIAAVTYAMNEPDTGSMAQGAPSAECPSRYEIDLLLSVATDDGLLAEAVNTTLVASSAAAVSFDAAVDLASVGGTTRPAAWDPADWPVNTLSLDGYGDGAALTISVGWQAASGARGPELDTASGGGTVETGTTEPSGMTEGVGSMSLSPR
jgi:hypothetical protein